VHLECTLRLPICNDPGHGRYNGNQWCHGDYTSCAVSTSKQTVHIALNPCVQLHLLLIKKLVTSEKIGALTDIDWRMPCVYLQYVRHCLSRGQIPELMLMSREGLYSNLPKNVLATPSYIQRGELCPALY